MKVAALASLVPFLIGTAAAGPLAFTACVSACNAGVVTCYAGLGLVFGTITGGLGAPVAAITCSSAQGACMVGCAPLAVAPIP